MDRGQYVKTRDFLELDPRDQLQAARELSSFDREELRINIEAIAESARLAAEYVAKKREGIIG